MGTAPHTIQPPGEPPSPIQTKPPFVAFQPGDVPPFQGIYLQNNDWIALSLSSNVGNTPIVVRYRYLTPEGFIKEGSFPFVIPSFGAFPSFTLGECWLLTLTVNATAAYVQGQWAFSQIVLIRTPQVSGNYAMIWQGFIPSNTTNGFPGTPSKEPTDGAGTIRAITGSTPAAGADINEVVPSKTRWALLALNAALTTSATVANRQVTALVDDGANTLFSSEGISNQAAGATLNYSLSTSVPSQTLLSGAQGLNFNLPIQIKTGFRIRTVTTAIQAGDQWTAPHYLVVEWPSFDP